MSRPNKARATIHGILVLDKPIGLSSMEAATACRTRAGGAKVGHAGTLDPLATGILVLAFGDATRHINRIMATDKRYRTVFDLSAFTISGDREHEPEPVAVAATPDEAMVRDRLRAFQGLISQQPPMFSAISIGGERAYQLARAGQTVDMPFRRVVVHRIDVIRYAWPDLELDILCGKGFYVRSLARDLGLALGTGGHVKSLRRTAVGPFDESMAIRLDDVPRPLEQHHLMPLEEAMRKVESQKSKVES
jgi:tRNA pseudouridine55 synthase